MTGTTRRANRAGCMIIWLGRRRCRTGPSPRSAGGMRWAGRRSTGPWSGPPRAACRNRLRQKSWALMKPAQGRSAGSTATGWSRSNPWLTSFVDATPGVPGSLLGSAVPVGVGVSLLAGLAHTTSLACPMAGKQVTWAQACTGQGLTFKKSPLSSNRFGRQCHRRRGQVRCRSDQNGSSRPEPGKC